LAVKASGINNALTTRIFKENLIASQKIIEFRQGRS